MAAEANDRRLLIVASRYSPVDRVPAIRVNTWGRLLAERGWTVTAVARRWDAPPDPEPVDLRLLVPGTGATTLQRATRAARARLARRGLSFAVPDRVAPVWRDLAGRVAAIAREVRPDVVLSSSPPHSVHLAGRAAADAAGAPWVVDFRDPLLGDTRYGGTGVRRLVRARLEAFEREVVDRAALVVTAIPGHGDDLRARHPGAAERIVTVTNGFPRALLDALRAAPERPGPPTVCVVGRTGDDELRTLASAIAGVRARRDGVRLVVIGDDSPGVAAARDLLGDACEWTGRLPHTEALRHVAAAAVLVSCTSVERAAVSGLSSRLFEYLATGRPIVAINPTAEDRTLLAPRGAILLDRPDAAALEAALADALDGRGAMPADELAAYRATFEREAQVAELDAALGRLLA